MTIQLFKRGMLSYVDDIENAYHFWGEDTKPFNFTADSIQEAIEFIQETGWESVVPAGTNGKYPELYLPLNFKWVYEADGSAFEPIID